MCDISHVKAIMDMIPAGELPTPEQWANIKFMVDSAYYARPLPQYPIWYPSVPVWPIITWGDSTSGMQKERQG